MTDNMVDTKKKKKWKRKEMKRNQNASGKKKKVTLDLKLKMKITLIKSTLGQSFLMWFIVYSNLFVTLKNQNWDTLCVIQYSFFQYELHSPNHHPMFIRHLFEPNFSYFKTGTILLHSCATLKNHERFKIKVAPILHTKNWGTSIAYLEFNIVSNIFVHSPILTHMH